ncbi:hypothetical protein BAUCODRAFT_147326 [Baudoinia panamericana UAMH 10762]|uniref:Uncharacterized protein n=1 Tax=Baudoinia panamericana (strain UAMH 10762) TaxID=717646 RepID=M2ND88_BAUPA|nr:uncharacterized protein BAUCODRAFT_147326 [Baudoinia panamericana UAMH 10762]EMC97174.1 hypothetical protein BAUCODRAFT_147326 [Baudoinia panamericana UAMH 10762]
MSIERKCHGRLEHHRRQVADYSALDVEKALEAVNWLGGEKMEEVEEYVRKRAWRRENGYESDSVHEEDEEEREKDGDRDKIDDWEGEAEDGDRFFRLAVFGDWRKGVVKRVREQFRLAARRLEARGGVRAEGG